MRNLQSHLACKVGSETPVTYVNCSPKMRVYKIVHVSKWNGEYERPTVCLRIEAKERAIEDMELPVAYTGAGKEDKWAVIPSPEQSDMFKALFRMFKHVLRRFWGAGHCDHVDARVARGECDSEDSF